MKRTTWKLWRAASPKAVLLFHRDIYDRNLTFQAQCGASLIRRAVLMRTAASDPHTK
jgi:hypothetical protein